MYPRGTIDIQFKSLLRAVWYCIPYVGSAFRSQSNPSVSERERDALICLSVRSGFDLILQNLNFPAGSEIIMSAITIPDMVRIVRAHGLVPVPVEVDFETLCVAPEQWALALSEKTKAIVIAHLFGSRMEMESIHSIAEAANLIVIEDCAQAFDGTDYRGDQRSHFTMFSFGMIKTATAIGGAVIYSSDRRALIRMVETQSTYPHQSTWIWLQKVLNACMLKIAGVPWILSALYWICSRCRLEIDDVVLPRSQGFVGDFKIQKFRKQPCRALKRLLTSRLREDHARRIELRKAYANSIYMAINSQGQIGANARVHSHWVCPLIAQEPETLIAELRGHGFDATQRSSRLVHIATMLHKDMPDESATLNNQQRHQVAIESNASHPAVNLMSRLVYIPIYPDMPPSHRTRLSQTIIEYQNKFSRHVTNDTPAEG